MSKGTTFSCKFQGFSLFLLTFAEEMKIKEFADYISAQLGHPATADQRRAMEVFGQFLAHRSSSAVMLMRGSAGTGKTALAGAMVRSLLHFRQRLMLLAPTGRAAKVLSLVCGQPAYTIHRRIYREKAYEGLDGVFQLNANLSQNVLFVVDEASMISAAAGDGHFGSGSLLDDLISFVYGGQNCRLLLIGDSAQLPPVGEEESPALSAEVLSTYGLTVLTADLHQVVRQEGRSGILWNATALRAFITHSEATRLPIITLGCFADVVCVSGDELVEQLSGSYSRVGLDETIVITRSNKRANVYNQGVRASVLDRQEALCHDDRLMVVRNNYHWTELERQSLPEGEQPVLPFLANGDTCRVERVSHVRELYGFHFADVRVSFPDYDDYEMEFTLLLDTLSTDWPALPREEHEQLFTQVMEDYQDLKRKTDRMKALRADPHFNAVQVKFAYAVTCHKAQGGQWRHVYLDQGYMTDDKLTPEYIHWLYTAFTRATERLFLVNWPSSQRRVLDEPPVTEN